MPSKLLRGCSAAAVASATSAALISSTMMLDSSLFMMVAVTATAFRQRAAHADVPTTVALMSSSGTEAAGAMPTTASAPGPPLTQPRRAAWDLPRAILQRRMDDCTTSANSRTRGHGRFVYSWIDELTRRRHTRGMPASTSYQGCSSSRPSKRLLRAILQRRMPFSNEE